MGRAESQHVACFVPVSTQQRLSVWWCTARLQVELTSSLLTPAVGWTTRFCVPGVANTATPAPPSLRGAAAPSVPRLPAPVRVTSPPVPRPAHPSPGDASLVARPAVQARRMFGAGSQNRCTQVFFVFFYHSLNHITRLRRIMSLRQRLGAHSQLVLDPAGELNPP